MNRTILLIFWLSWGALMAYQGYVFGSANIVKEIKWIDKPESVHDNEHGRCNQFRSKYYKTATGEGVPIIVCYITGD